MPPVPAFDPAWPGWSQQQTVVLPVSPETWPLPTAPVRIDGIVFAPKRELHVTLIGRALEQELRAAIANGRFAEVELRAAFETLDWRFERSSRHLLLRKPFVEDGQECIAHSIIELVDLPAMAAFHARLGALLERALPVPPPHATLYVAGDDGGIGVPDEAALRRLAVRAVSAGELAAGRVGGR